jgi:hypothetical protein
MCARTRLAYFQRGSLPVKVAHSSTNKMWIFMCFNLGIISWAGIESFTFVLCRVIFLEVVDVFLYCLTSSRMRHLLPRACWSEAQCLTSERVMHNNPPEGKCRLIIRGCEHNGSHLMEWGIFNHISWWGRVTRIHWNEDYWLNVRMRHSDSHLMEWGRVTPIHWN